MKQGPIRVLCVFSTLDRGGAETMCMNLFRHIDRETVQFDFVKHTSRKGDFEDEICSLGGRIYEAPRYHGYNHMQYLGWWKKHLEQHKEHRIIHCHFFTMASVIGSAANKSGCILIVHSHHMKSDSLIKSLMLKRIERNADYCFACSKPAGEWLFPHKKYIVVNNAIDSKRFIYDLNIRKSYRETLDIENEIVLGSVANFSAFKNPLGLIEVFHAVHMKNPQTKLLWIGDGGLRTEIEQKLRDEKLTDSVILTGVRSDVPALLQAMDIFLLPSFYEGLPVVLIEAQAAGLPCFVSDTVTREADITGLCHYLPLDDTACWADAILSDHTERKDTSQQIIDAGYDIHTTAKWLQEFYLRIADEQEDRHSK